MSSQSRQVLQTFSVSGKTISEMVSDCISSTFSWEERSQDLEIECAAIRIAIHTFLERKVFVECLPDQ